MPAMFRFLLPMAALAIIGSAIAVAVSGDESESEAADATAQEASVDQQDQDQQDQDGDEAAPVDLSAVPVGQRIDFGPPPEWPTGPWSAETQAALDEVIVALQASSSPSAPLRDLVATGDPRLVWPITDMLRFVGLGDSAESLTFAITQLLPEFDLDQQNPWGDAIDHLIGWDVPVPEDQYVEFKRDLYGIIQPQWTDLMVDGTDIDWRYVGWGGVGIDDRAFGSTEPCRCIPALDNPPVTPADQGDWYPDDALIFGLVINDEARAYPKNIMEVHEMVNDTLGGRDLGIPYCTLCGSAQAYFTDELPDELLEEYGRPVFRTSGLLIRSNKMMFELNTRTFVDTFLGIPASGPLAEAGVVFDQASVITTTWGQWKAEHPDTTIIAEDGGLGRSYELDPLDGRDDNGPIFPIGDVDPRLPVQEPVLGVVTESGRPIAFHVESAAGVLAIGERIEIEGIELRLDGGGVRALRDGQDAGGHQAFWFAWSQFHPDTAVWPLDFQ